jgi:hypothetical protein
MFKKKLVLEYESALNEYPNPIVPAKNIMPNWYKKIPKWKDNKIFTVENGLQQSLKQCMPFMDGYTTGYLVTLPYDLYVTLSEHGTPYLGWKGGNIFPPRSRDISDQNLIPQLHYETEYTWNLCVSFTIPKGYSIIFTHPFNRYDLPFTTLTGIIDGGLIMEAHGNAPFYIKKGFEGLIPQGTPIAQLIPFRQENWKSKVTKGLIKRGEEHKNKSLLLFSGWYKQTFWTRKKYD